MDFSIRPVLRLPFVVRHLLLAWALGSAGLVAAQGAAPASAGGPAPERERSVNEWLMRMHEASRQRNYVGTFVVSSNSGAMSSARIWHACDREQQVEKVENLTGAPRSTLRRNNEVITLWPDKRIARTERRESLGLFPELLKSSETAIAEFYAARRMGSDRVAGFDADVVQITPKDTLRFGYRIWSEKRSGLVVKLQTLGGEGEVLEQAAFSELQLDAPLRADKLAQLMAPPEGWRVERADAVKTDAATEGWTLRANPPGFKPMSCWRRSGTTPVGTLQWIFSDGLASVSLFIEAYDRQRHLQEGVFAAGATQTLTRRVQDAWWLTVVGEVPPQTLRSFAQNLERRK